MKHLIVGGWGIPQEKVIEVFEKQLIGEVQFHHPTAALSEIDFHAFNAIHAYSLGALIVLKEVEDRYADSNLSVKLYAPILSFCCEDGLGGKIPRKQLEIMIRQFNKNPLRTLNNFYDFAELGYRVDELPYCEKEMQWGLNYLLEKNIQISEKLQKHLKHSVIGDSDTLLDAAVSEEFIPNLKILKGIGHSIEDLVWNDCF